MNIKRFFGKNSREALSMVRKALGEDAVIISNRASNGGNEILAVSEADMHAMANQFSPLSADMLDSPTMQLPQETFEDEEEEDYADAPTLLSILNQNKRAVKAPEFVPEKPKAVMPAAKVSPRQEAPSRRAAMEQPSFDMQANDDMSGLSHQELSQQFSMMLNEMRGMRSRVETQLTAMAWNNNLQHNPVKAKILSTLLAANFSASLSRQLAEKLPNSLEMNRALAWIKGALARNLDTIKDESELLDQGGVFALVGPTGVGKTTTTAKLAARYVMKHGTQNLGLITTDGYRIGGHEQLRIYGKILGVMVYAVKDEADLKIALNELKHKHCILVDTVGVSQRDRMVTEQIAMLSKMNVNIKKLLCLNATCTGETLTDVIRAYKGRALDGCIITKLDEAATIGNTLDVIIREKLKLYYTTHGQRVPEDMQVANKVELISRALTLNSTSWPFQYLEEELPFVVANVDNYADYVKATEVNHA
ncbi:flagellar biosynthesis protein FlhF [Methylotenera sp. 1P/1]|uniref:flagellar biosynthesis protein FlhF n=1 Tax=Methylotenera sp. 1P/1 TaxID=1131551 RepID=UPI00038138BD|nr:flagellar biosynthesis protein FlhF [Methylotenera sp. 1P/1]